MVVEHEVVFTDSSDVKEAYEIKGKELEKKRLLTFDQTKWSLPPHFLQLYYMK